MASAAMDASTLEALLGLPLAEARRRLDAVGTPATLVKSEPPRPRHPFPPEDEWRVVRVKMGEDGLTLVIVPTIAYGAAPAPPAPPSP